MKQELIQTFLMQNGDCFDPIQLPEIQNQLAQLDDSRAGYVLSDFSGAGKPAGRLRHLVAGRHLLRQVPHL